MLAFTVVSIGIPLFSKYLWKSKDRPGKTSHNITYSDSFVVIAAESKWPSHTRHYLWAIMPHPVCKLRFSWVPGAFMEILGAVPSDTNSGEMAHFNAPRPDLTGGLPLLVPSLRPQHAWTIVFQVWKQCKQTRLRACESFLAFFMQMAFGGGELNCLI